MNPEDVNRNGYVTKDDYQKFVVRLENVERVLAAHKESTMTVTIKEEDLAQFIGTEGYFRHPLCKAVVYTDGVEYLASNGAGWLVDMVASHLHTHKGLVEKCDGMLFTKFTLEKTRGGRLEARKDTHAPVIFSQEVEYTDLPFDVDIWAQHDGERWVMMLPSEY